MVPHLLTSHMNSKWDLLLEMNGSVNLSTTPMAYFQRRQHQNPHQHCILSLRGWGSEARCNIVLADFDHTNFCCSPHLSVTVIFTFSCWPSFSSFFVFGVNAIEDCDRSSWVWIWAERIKWDPGNFLHSFQGSLLHWLLLIFLQRTSKAEHGFFLYYYIKIRNFSLSQTMLVWVIDAW